MSRNIDIRESDEYEAAQNEAANHYVNTAAVYANSYQAFAYKRLFTVGADVADDVLLDEDALLALIAGKRWALEEQASADVVTPEEGR